MDDRRGRPHRVLGAEDGRQLRILDIDELERGLRDLDGIGRDRRHFLADEARHALGKQSEYPCTYGHSVYRAHRRRSARHERRAAPWPAAHRSRRCVRWHAGCAGSGRRACPAARHRRHSGRGLSPWRRRPRVGPAGPRPCRSACCLHAITALRLACTRHKCIGRTYECKTLEAPNAILPLIGIPGWALRRLTEFGRQRLDGFRQPKWRRRTSTSMQALSHRLDAGVIDRARCARPGLVP